MYTPYHRLKITFKDVSGARFVRAFDLDQMKMLRCGSTAGLLKLHRRIAIVDGGLQWAGSRLLYFWWLW